MPKISQYLPHASSDQCPSSTFASDTIVLTIASSHVLTRVLFGLSPLDPLTFAAVGALLAAIAMIACWLPARRAAKVDPMEALRCE